MTNLYYSWLYGFGATIFPKSGAVSIYYNAAIGPVNWKECEYQTVPLSRALNWDRGDALYEGQILHFRISDHAILRVSVDRYLKDDGLYTGTADYVVCFPKESIKGTVFRCPVCGRPGPFPFKGETSGTLYADNTITYSDRFSRLVDIVRVKCQSCLFDSHLKSFDITEWQEMARLGPELRDLFEHQCSSETIAAPTWEDPRQSMLHPFLHSKKRKLGLIKFLLEPGESSEPATEFLWADALDDGTFRLRNTPFMAKGVAKGDIITAVLDGDLDLRFESIQKDGGRFTTVVTILPGNDSMHYALERFLRDDPAFQYEPAYNNKWSISYPPELLKPLWDFLERGEGSWVYVTSKCPSGDQLAALLELGSPATGSE